MESQIRKATNQDIDKVLELFLEMIDSEDTAAKNTAGYLMENRIKRDDFNTSAKEELLREINEDNSVYLLAESNSEVIGYVRGSVFETKDPFFKTVKIGYLNALMVCKKYNGLGIASKLNNEIENWFRSNGCNQIQLEVFENNPAIDIYKKWGYKTFLNKMSKHLSA